MSSLSPGIVVNGTKIEPEQIDAEVQYHPAPSFAEAKYEAMRALVIKELLVQRAKEVYGGASNLSQEEEDGLINKLLSDEVTCPDPQEEELARYYAQNKSRFVTSPIFEVSHILYLAPSDLPEERQSALEQAKSAIIRLQENPELFEKIAKAESGCSSKESGGHLGQIVRGQTLPDFEKALLGMEEGTISLDPVASEVGFHIIKVHQRQNGKEMPYDMVRSKIAAYLKEKSWNTAFHQYVQFLVGRSKISGFRLLGADSPLVQ